MHFRSCAWLAEAWPDMSGSKAPRLLDRPRCGQSVVVSLDKRMKKLCVRSSDPTAWASKIEPVASKTTQKSSKNIKHMQKSTVFEHEVEPRETWPSSSPCRESLGWAVMKTCGDASNQLHNQIPSLTITTVDGQNIQTL